LRLTAVWEKEYRQFCKRNLEGGDNVYVWADGARLLGGGAGGVACGADNAMGATRRPSARQAIQACKAMRSGRCFFDFPAEHWKHLWMGNPIESSFATGRLRQRVTKGAGSRTKALTMAFKLRMLAQERCLAQGCPSAIPVRVGVWFVDGAQIEYHEDEDNRKEAA
jgi:hypothetical protein